MSRSAPIRPLAFLILGLMLGILPGCGASSPTAQAAAVDRAPLPALIPAPASLQAREGAFEVEANTPLYATGMPATAVAQRFAALMSDSRSLELKLKDAAGRVDDGIVFAIDPNMKAVSAEAYALDVTPQRIRVSARDERGLFYGAVTLWQLLTLDRDDRIRVPALRIDDAPRFAWRGLMLDSARHFQSVEEIKRLLDAMALHKLNTFHWHLTDDQGWRIEIKRYPKLTEIGGCRIPAGEAGVDATTGQAKPYCGYYTQQQIRDVVRYAAERQITVVPEIDVPGHAQAAIAAYPELGVLGSRPAVSNEWGVHAYLFNTEENTFAFLENVLAEVTGLFPGAYVHIGGDEAIKDQWQASARVQARMRELGVKDEMAMQSHLIKRLQKFLVARNRRLIGWDEILEGGLPPEATVMSWRGIEGGIEAANLGHDVVMSPSSELYLDYLQTDSPNEPPGRPATIPLRQVYAFEPVPAALASDKRQHIIGVQANVWTEHMRTFARVQHAVFPRIAALAETAWSPKENKNWESFVQRLPTQLRRYRALGIGYAQTPFEVRSALVEDRTRSQVQMTLSNSLGYPDIRYTTDGSEPIANSPVYRTPLELAVPAQVRAAVFVDGEPLAAASVHRIDASSLLRRSDEELAMCTGALMLRLEDDGPAAGERALFNVDIFNPCWEWKAANLQGIAAIQVRAGRMPYYFQLAHDEPNRKFKPAQSAHGELVIRAGCEGPQLASVPLPAAPDADGFVTLSAKLAAPAKKENLCLFFTGDTRPAMWVLDTVTLQPN